MLLENLSESGAKTGMENMAVKHRSIPKALRRRSSKALFLLRVFAVYFEAAVG